MSEELERYCGTCRYWYYRDSPPRTGECYLYPPGVWRETRTHDPAHDACDHWLPTQDTGMLLWALRRKYEALRAECDATGETLDAMTQDWQEARDALLRVREAVMLAQSAIREGFGGDAAKDLSRAIAYMRPMLGEEPEEEDDGE